MRLDKYLKVSRLIKRRTVANEACDNGLVTVNGKPARASYEVKEGDQITRRFGVRTVTGEDLHIGKLSLEGGELYVDGRITSISYEDTPNRQGGFFSRLFG